MNRFHLHPSPTYRRAMFHLPVKGVIYVGFGSHEFSDPFRCIGEMMSKIHMLIPRAINGGHIEGSDVNNILGGMNTQTRHSKFNGNLSVIDDRFFPQGRKFKKRKTIFVKEDEF